MLVPYSLNAHIVISTREQLYLKQSTGNIPQINLQFYLKGAKCLYVYMLAVQNEKQQNS
jgi:hypothetical protein